MEEKKAVHLSKQMVAGVCALLICAGLIRLMVAYLTVHYYDVNYYFDWALGAAKDFAGVYENVPNMDYPPLFLYLLFFTGKLLENPAIQQFDPYVMILLKGWQILFDLLVASLLYLFFRRRSEVTGGVACALWLVNPAMLLNVAYWGQTDSMMLFFLLLAFALLSFQKPVWATVAMTLASLAKFQSIYFLPLFALALLSAFPIKRVATAVVAGVTTGTVVFLPFMLRSGWDLPWRVYTGGFESYPAASLNAFNYYTLAGLNRASAWEKLFGIIPGETFSWCMIGLVLVLITYFYFTAKEQSLWLLGLVLIQTIFMFTTRMHERYQVPALLFCLAAALTHKNVGLYAGYLSLTLITFFNQFVVIEDTINGGRGEAWMSYYNEIMRMGSLINLLAYILILIVIIRIFYINCINST